jgi:hypothetical protein
MSEETLWNDEALINGTIRIVAAPIAPQYIPASDGEVVEYLLSFPMHIVDHRDWKPIEYLADGVLVTIERPLSLSAPYLPGNRFGNEGAEAFCSLVRLKTPVGASLGYQEGWKIVEKLLQWIRVKARHYWILHGSAGVGALYRGTVFMRDRQKLTLQNMATYAPGVVVRPLTEAIWLSIGDELANSADVPLSDALYCDALLSVAGRNEMKSLLEAGVAAEVAITQLLLEVSLTKPDSQSKTDFRAKGDWDPFKEKLIAWPQRLGLEAATTFTFPGMPSGWVQKVQELYALRNGVAHAGIRKAIGPSTHVGVYIFAANALLEYCRAQRLGVGLRDYSLPVGVIAYEQTVACHSAYLSIDSQPMECHV